MSSTRSLRPHGRRVLAVAASALAIGALGAGIPSPATIDASEAAMTTDLVAPAAALAGAVTATSITTVVATTPSVPTARTAVPAAAPKPAAKAAVAPFAYGTKNYNKWWARSYMAKRYKWRTARQYICLVHLWNAESNWSTRAHNSGSGAHGIPQALPGRKMASAGPNWRSNPHTQIKWGLSYIKGRYGNPCGAWSSFQRKGWY